MLHTISLNSLFVAQTVGLTEIQPDAALYVLCTFKRTQTLCFCAHNIDLLNNLTIYTSLSEQTEANRRWGGGGGALDFWMRYIMALRTQYMTMTKVCFGVVGETIWVDKQNCVGHN